MVVEILFWVTNLKRARPGFSMSRIHDRADPRPGGSIFGPVRGSGVHDRLHIAAPRHIQRHQTWSKKCWKTWCFLDVLKHPVVIKWIITGLCGCENPENMEFGKFDVKKKSRFCYINMEQNTSRKLLSLFFESDYYPPAPLVGATRLRGILV